MQRLPVSVTTYLDAVADRVADVLGPQLLGVYTTGSLALGDYRPGRSDIDLAAVATGTVDPPSSQLLAQRLDHAVLPSPAAGLEFVLYPEVTGQNDNRRRRLPAEPQHRSRVTRRGQL